MIYLKKTDNAEGGIINLAKGGRINYGNGSGGLFDSFLTAKNVDRGINLLQNNRGIVDFFANNLTSLPSSGRAFAKNLAGSTSPINEDFFSNNQLEEIKSRTAESMANKSMRYRPNVIDDPSKNEFYGDFDTINNVIGYSENETKRPISVKGIFTDPKVDIDATLGKAVYKQNSDGTISVIDKHDFDGIGGGSTLYGKEQGNLMTGREPKAIGIQGLPFLEPYEFPGYEIDGETQFDHKYETQESMLEGAIEAYKNGKISASKLSRIIGGMYGQQGFINNSKYGSGESLIKKNQFLSSIPVNINLGKISQIDKLKANKNFANYIFKIRKNARRYADIQTKPTPTITSTPTTIQTTNRDDRPSTPSKAQNVARTASRVSPSGKTRAYGLAEGGIVGLKR